MTNRTDLSSWKSLEQLANKMKQTHMNDLFASDPQRFNKFSLKLPDLLFDYSKNLIDDTVLKTLLQLTEDVELPVWREKMFNAERINMTEDRAVLHTALRNRSQTPLYFDGENVTQDVEDQLAKMKGFVEQVRQGHWKGFSGKRITDIVN
ncbi:MAG: glucose-6-phosphate isomerase, partial [Thalassotalea sp.]|nr:glucose-6-phosphate isomerase [Thalassotalea sp.]